MSTESVSAGAVAIVKLPAEVDLASAPAVRDELLSSVNRGGVHLIIDATETTFLDSSGINALLRARERTERLGGSLHLVTTSRAVLRVLEITQLDRVIVVVPTVDSAQRCVEQPDTIHTCNPVPADLAPSGSG